MHSRICKIRTLLTRDASFGVSLRLSRDHFAAILGSFSAISGHLGCLGVVLSHLGAILMTFHVYVAPFQDYNFGRWTEHSRLCEIPTSLTFYLNGQFCGAYMSMAQDACLPASVRVASSCLRDIQFSCLLTMAGHPRTSAKPAAMKRPAAYRRLCRVCDLTPAQNGSAYDGMCHRCHSRIAKLKLCVLCGKKARRYPFLTFRNQCRSCWWQSARRAWEDLSEGGTTEQHGDGED